MNAQRGGQLVVLMFVLLGTQAFCGEDLKFTDYRSAMAAGAGLYNSGNLAASRQPFEAAVELARNDREKNDAYTPLIKVYAESGAFEKMYEAAEHIVENATYPAKASLTVRSLLSNAHRKKQLDAMKKRYEGRLEEDPRDRTALTMMAAYHQTASRDFGKRAEFLSRLIQLDEEQGREPAPELSADLAFAWKLSGKYVQSAELYEKTATSSEELQSSCFMEAAEAWHKAGNGEQAVAAAVTAHELGPDKRAKYGLYRWHRTLGEIFLDQKKKDEALHHLQAALDETSVATYKTQLEDLIAKAQAL